MKHVLVLLKNLFICVYSFMNYVQREFENLTLRVHLGHLNININMGSLHFKHWLL